MDTSKFQDDAPGRLVPIEHNHSAFVPHPLPPNNLQIRQLLDETYPDARDVIGELRGLTGEGRLAIRPQVLLRPLQREESLRSSSIEGTFATPEELLRAELEGAGVDDGQSWREVFNYNLAIQEGEQILAEHGVSNWVIRALHQKLMSGVRGDDKSPGKYRTDQVYIGFQPRFVPPPGYLVQQCMDEFSSFCSAQDDALPLLVKPIIAHYQFEAIHPFMDGNGRVGRLLLSLMLADNAQLGRPWLYLSEFFEEHRDDYMNGLLRVSTDNDWEGWIRFCLEAMCVQGRRTIDRCRQILALREDWIGRISRVELKPRAIELLDELMERPVTNVAQARSVLGVTENTAREDLRKLEKAGIVELIPDSRPAIYYARELMRIIHRQV